MSAILINIVIGLATSIIAGGAVWVWQHTRNSQILRRKAAFFDLNADGNCLIVMSQKYRRPQAADHQVVQAMIEIAVLANELGSTVTVMPPNEIHGGNGNRTEFCMGGPGGDANPRTGGYLNSYFRGVNIMPRNAGPDSLAIIVRDRKFLRKENIEEFALVAKFTPLKSTHSVFIFCGQTPTSTRASFHYLNQNYREVIKTVASIEKFCLMLRIVSPKIYGHEMVELAEDVTTSAFFNQSSTISAL